MKLLVAMHTCYDYTAKDVTDRKKNWMPQDAAEYVQHSGHFAAHSINLDSVNLLENNLGNGCYFS